MAVAMIASIISKLFSKQLYATLAEVYVTKRPLADKTIAGN
jgi:hypothetical protein